MALLSPQQISITGAAQTLSAAVASDTMPPGARFFLWVKTTGTATTVTLVTPPHLDRFGVTLGDVSITCPATGDRLIGPIDPALADPTTRLVTANFTGALTGVTRALVAL
jgi:hypothetical protein